MSQTAEMGTRAFCRAVDKRDTAPISLLKEMRTCLRFPKNSLTVHCIGLDYLVAGKHGRRNSAGGLE